MHWPRALVYQANGRSNCHKVNGVGSDIGPPRNGLGKRRSRSRVEVPPFKFPAKDVENLTNYLFPAARINR